MPKGNLHVERADEIAIVRVDRPPANAIELGLVKEFEAAFDCLVSPDTGAIVLTGTGSFFSGGLDLKLVPSYSWEQQQALINSINSLVAKLYGCRIPVVGAINGHAIAGGLILAIACDYRIGPDGDSSFGLTEARVGIPFPAAPMAVLHGELSPANVRTITLLADHFGPREALARTLLDELQPTEQVLPRALEVAREMATIPRQAYGRIKHQVRQAALRAITEAVEKKTDPMLTEWITDEAGGASAAVLEQRTR